MKLFAHPIIVTVILACFTLSACGSNIPVKRIDIAESKALPEPALEKIADDVWIHKSYEIIKPWGPILSQGLVVKTDAGVFMIDTAWNNEDTEKLLNLIKTETGVIQIAALLTHAHQDKMGGMNALHEAGIETFAHVYTNEDAPQRGLTPAKTIVLENSTQSTNADGITLFYPGPGHTRDNIVIYYAPAKVLFGGCLIRPGDSNNLGNTADGDVANWAKAVRKVAAQFPDAKIVIPSHGAAGGRELLDHTIALAEAEASE